MQSRRDQVEAQSYLLSRLTSALLRAEPDGLEPPTKRETRALLGGLLLGALALGGVAIWALLSGSGSTAWRAAGTLIVDKSSGSRFLLVDGQLRPVVNLASARLAVGSGLKISTVSSNRIKNVPRGDPIGIPGAPDMLPAPALVNRGVWRVCLAEPPAASTGMSQPRASATTGEAVAGTVVEIGFPPAADRVGDNEALYVAVGSEQYLIWRGQRLKVGPSWVPDVLGFGSAVPTQVTQQWLDLLPVGPALTPIMPAGRGEPGPMVDGKRAIIGQVFQTGSGESTGHYLALADGLAPLTATMYALTSAAPGVPAERSISSAELARATRVEMPTEQRALPAAPPLIRPLSRGVSACLEYPGREDPKVVDVVRWSVPAAERPAAAPSGATASATFPVVPNGGALVGTDPTVAFKDQPQALVDDTGRAYPLTADAITALGYSNNQGFIVPPTWLLLLPHGPLLTTPGKG